MRRFVEALLLVLGFTWGLAPLAPSAVHPAAGQGLGVERTYLEGSATGPHALFTPLFASFAPAASWLREPPARALAQGGVLLPEKRRFLRLGRLRLEGG